LVAIGIKETEFPALQPLFQKKIWDRFKPGQSTDQLDQIIAQLKKEDHRFHMEGGSWTSSISWVKGYDSVLGPMERPALTFSRRC